MSLRVGLNGAGRIGRALLRQTLGDPAIEIVGVNDVAGAATIAHLLRHDSVHGPFPAAAADDGPDVLRLDGRAVRFFAERDPARIPWETVGADVVVEATGRFSGNGGARGHLRPGVKRVLVTAVADEADATIVLGPHDGRPPKGAKVVSCGSCTTHAATLPLWLIDRWYGIEAAQMTTVHCTTGSQHPMDAPHSDLRRARSCLLSMIPTTTSAARGIVRALPQLEGRLSCLSVRVPTATVSLIEVVAQTKRPAEAQDVVAERFRRAALEDPGCRGRLGASDEPLVSIDFSGDRRSSIVDLPLIERPGERLLRLIAWYDNECGYTGRVAELLRIWSGEAPTEDR
ncbi:MAG: glyceraldehyde 3-phosphate dehydrogenase NAD-binding domain-containing protein [Candidatus Polarisedimenticolia bacterium]|nr:type I glyceraldehyde-3-phosphate dehydrogenase [bacterium]